MPENPKLYFCSILIQYKGYSFISLLKNVLTDICPLALDLDPWIQQMILFIATEIW